MVLSWMFKNGLFLWKRPYRWFKIKNFKLGVCVRKAVRAYRKWWLVDDSSNSRSDCP